MISIPFLTMRGYLRAAAEYHTLVGWGIYPSTDLEFHIRIAPEIPYDHERPFVTGRSLRIHLDSYDPIIGHHARSCDNREYAAKFYDDFRRRNRYHPQLRAVCPLPNPFR